MQSSGSGTGTNGVDVIINCCFEIGDRGANNATGTPFGSKDGDDSGNWQNNNRQYIFGTDIIVANGDFQNSNNTMTVCDVDVKLNKSGNFQINSGTLEGEGLCIAAEDAIENSGTWTADVVAWYSHIQNSIIQNNPITGFIPSVESDMNDILDQCFTECCTGDECTLDDPTIAVVCDDAGTPFDPSDDTFTYTIQVTGTDTGNSYSISGDDSHSGLSYGVINGPFGPFDISSGNLTITITDSDDSECQLEDQVVSAPATCSDQIPPDVTHMKNLSSVTLLADGTYDVVYSITVTNTGGSVGSYDLYDDPDFDGDININSAAYTSNAPGNPGNNLVGNGPWTLGDDISINVNATHTYTLTVNVTLNLTDGISDDDYTACGETNTIPQAGEGLYNLSQLDTNNDGIPDEEDEACGDLPFITHVKDITSIDQQPNGTYNVLYTVVVSNIGGATGTYDLYDDPTFDDDITINLASFTSNAPGNPGNALAGGGPWQLADDQSIIAGDVQTYILTVNVTLDLRDGVGNDIYTACSETTGTPIPGEGLYNLSQLDRNNDGIPDEEDDACGDLPFVIHSKSLGTISQEANGTYNVSYIITVSNIGGAAGSYDLFDDPTFDDDISINSASYVSNAPGNPGNALAGDGPWTLADDQSIAAGGIQTYTLTVNVTLDLTDGQGDDDYYACGETTGTPIPGEGLYNLSQLDRNNDGIPDEEDDACGDLPFITHYKDIVDILPQANGTYFVIYTVNVSNIGGATGSYDLYDEPTFDDDIAINSASYASDAPGNPGNALAGTGPWQLADDQSIVAGGVQTYTLSVNVTLDLLDGQGDDDYTACSETTGTPIPGEGLYNLSQLDRNNDGIPDEEDDACGDLPFITHDKSFGSVERQDDGTYDVTYFVTVWNLGGVPGSYTLEDTPFFDDDISINSASYTSDAAGNPGGNLAGSGPWLLASLQPITHGDVHTYTLVMNVSINTTDGIADDEYTACGETTGTPLAGEGLFNQTTLDVNDDGIPEEIDDACGDLPAKIGDYVWEDISRDGIQDANEPPIEGVTVHLKDGNNNIISTTTTDETGMYCFEELDPGTYSVQFEEPYQFRFTFKDQGNDDTVDSDADEDMGGMTPPKVIEEGDIDLTCDAGFYRRPGTNINDPCNCVDNSTTAEDGQFGEEIEITNTYAGDTWVIIQQTGMYLTSSPLPPAAPIPVPLGTELEEHPVGGNLSDYSYAFIHIDDLGYTVTVTNGFDTLSIENNCEYPDFVELEIPLEPLCIIDPPFPLSGVPNVPGDVNFYLDGQLITVIDPAALGLGQFELVAEINPTDPEECISTVITIVVVIDDCVANLGDYVWEDMDADGNQDPGEPGIPDVTVKLLDTNNNVLDVTTTDEDGYYQFTNLAPGDYVVMFITPDGKIQTVQDSGDTDETDSDAGDNGMTGVINLEEGETDNTHDAG
ncbi:MAG: hypothetical protein DWQ02_24045 [Bacteroidetes bacterium]|nr:MAG: hypothetical protein DWQ02_24045 [Bacteroidota bacterium]